MKNQWLTAALAAILLAFSASPAAAGDFGVSVEFSDKEIATIRAYYRDHLGSSSHKGDGNKGNGKNGNGKNKGNKSLPPGIAMNLQRGKALPPGIAKQALPNGLISQLPAPPKGFERLEVDGRVLLVEVATQVIHDVLEDVILR